MNTFIKDNWFKIKKMLQIISIVFTICIILAMLAVGYLGFKKYQDSQENNKVFVGVKYDDVEKCSPEYPLAILISNESNKTIRSIDITIKITRKGHSTDISYNHLYILDRIVPPKKSYVQCAKYSLDPAYEQYNKAENLDFSTTSKYIDFQE